MILVGGIIIKMLKTLRKCPHRTRVRWRARNLVCFWRNTNVKMN